MICTTYFLTFFSELIPPTGKVIHCYLDNDDAGRRVVDSLHELLGDKVQDMFAPYPLYKDLNDFLRNKKKIP